MRSCAHSNRPGEIPATFTFAAQVDCGTDAASRASALEVGRQFRRAGADHVILGIPGGAAPDAVLPMAREVAEPLRDTA